MAKKVELKERGTNEVIYPVTRKECILDFEETADIPVVSDTVNGLMSSADKVKLDSLKGVYTIYKEDINNGTFDYNEIALAITNKVPIIVTERESPRFFQVVYSLILDSGTDNEELVLYVINPENEYSVAYIKKDGTHLFQDIGSYNLLYLFSPLNSRYSYDVQNWLIKDSNNNYYFNIYTYTKHIGSNTYNVSIKYIDNNEIVSLLIVATENKVLDCTEVSREPLGGTTEIATQTKDGLLSKEDKKKLDTVPSIPQINTTFASYNQSSFTIPIISKSYTNGSWEETSSSLSIQSATSTTAGLLSAEDKTKLDSLSLTGNITILTEAEYNALEEKDPDTIYFIK